MYVRKNNVEIWERILKSLRFVVLDNMSIDGMPCIQIFVTHTSHHSSRAVRLCAMCFQRPKS